MLLTLLSEDKFSLEKMGPDTVSAYGFYLLGTFVRTCSFFGNTEQETFLGPFTLTLFGTFNLVFFEEKLRLSLETLGNHLLTVGRGCYSHQLQSMSLLPNLKEQRLVRSQVSQCPLQGKRRSLKSFWDFFFFK